MFKKGTKPRKNLRRAIQSVINKNEETKQGFISLSAQSRNSGISVAGDCWQIIPNMLQGVSDNQRIGDRVKAQRMAIKGAVVYNPSTGSYGTYANSRIAVRLMIVQPKNYGDYVSVINNAPTWLPALLRKGNTNVAFTGIMNDLWAPINTDAITVYYNKIIYITAPYQLTAAGAQQMGGMTKFFSKTIKFRGSGKQLNYDTSASTGILPTNFAPVMIAGYVHMDGSGPDVLTTAVQFSFDSNLYYKDA